jgi:hypothetical protein
MRISAGKFADIRNNMFTADTNYIQTRIADKTADMSLKLRKLIPVFYCLDKSFVSSAKNKNLEVTV